MSAEHPGPSVPSELVPASYFERLSDDLFQPTRLTIGAWNMTEQHVAPLFGLVTHAVEREHRSRRADPLILSRLSFDILGTLTLEPFRIEIRLIRAGRTIELVEATVFQNDRPAILSRAWFSNSFDTAALAGTPLPSIPQPDDMELYDFGGVWDGDCVRSVEVRRQVLDTGRAICWCRTERTLLDK